MAKHIKNADAVHRLFCAGCTEEDFREKPEHTTAHPAWDAFQVYSKIYLSNSQRNGQAFMWYWELFKQGWNARDVWADA